MIKKNNVIVRVVLQNDIEMIFGWMNNPDVMRYNGLPFRFYSLQDIKDYYLKSRMDQSESGILIIQRTDDRALGIIEFNHSKPMFTGVDLQLLAGEIEENLDLDDIVDAVTVMTKFVFDDLGYERIKISLAGELLCICEKLESIGFLKEAVIREERFVNGRYIDSVYMGLLKEDYITAGAI